LIYIGKKYLFFYTIWLTFPGKRCIFISWLKNERFKQGVSMEKKALDMCDKIIQKMYDYKHMIKTAANSDEVEILHDELVQICEEIEAI
jgi:hypothetical protein